MKFPVSMLTDYVATSLSAEQLGDLLTMAGFELEGIEEVDGEAVLDIKVMSNRGDGLSVFGLAREVLAKDAESTATALYLRAAQRFGADEAPVLDKVGEVTVQVETPACGRYAAALFRGVRNGESPAWIQRRLEQAGMRPISLLVDLTNYVLLEVGQPLHAFDLAKLNGPRIVVREARDGERLTTLNGVEHELKAGQMMICDAAGPIAAAGIMGGLETEVDENTTDVLLESAHFLNTSVRRTRKQLGLSTEASYRFERYVDPDGVVAAIERFAELLAEAGQESARQAGVVDVYPGKVRRAGVRVRLARVRQLLGMEVSVEEARRALEALGFELHGDGEEWRVVPPSWRPDVVREEDVAEEVARVVGYERIPERLPEGGTTPGGPARFEAYVDRIRERAIRQGFHQTISHSLGEAHPLDDGRWKRVGPRNPNSPEMALLRNSVLPNLVENARRNGGKDLHLFEIGRAFWTGAEGYLQRLVFGMLSTGELEPPHWSGGTGQSADFFSLKGSLQAIFEGISERIEFAEGHDPRLHPTRQAMLVTKLGGYVGIFGQLHPDLAERLDLAGETYLAEVDLFWTMPERERPFGYRTLSRNPSVGRDVSFVIPKRVPYSDVEEAIATAAGDVLEAQRLFDVYSGKGVPEGSHSLAVSLTLRKHGNFTDEEANQVREKVVAALEELGAQVRR